jgi:hypothetical protein
VCSLGCVEGGQNPDSRFEPRLKPSTPALPCSATFTHAREYQKRHDGVARTALTVRVSRERACGPPNSDRPLRTPLCRETVFSAPTESRTADERQQQPGSVRNALAALRPVRAPPGFSRNVSGGPAAPFAPAHAGVRKRVDVAASTFRRAPAPSIFGSSASTLPALPRRRPGRGLRPGTGGASTSAPLGVVRAGHPPRARHRSGGNASVASPPAPVVCADEISDECTHFECTRGSAWGSETRFALEERVGPN